MSSELPTHSLKSFYTLLKFLFLKEKEDAKLHPLLQRNGSLVSHSGGKYHPKLPAEACTAVCPLPHSRGTYMGRVVRGWGTPTYQWF